MRPPLIPSCALGLTEEALSAWRDALLPPTHAEQIARHVGACDSCQGYLSGFEHTRNLLLWQRPPQLRDAVRAGLLRRLRQGAGGSRPLWGTLRNLALAGIAVLVLIGMAATLISLHNGLGGPGPTTVPPTATTGKPLPTITPAVTSTQGGQSLTAAGWKTAQGIGVGNVPRVAFAASVPSTGYACISQSDAIHLSKTTDGGLTWRSLANVLHGGACLITVNPTDAQDVAVNDANPFHIELTRSRDGGATWQTANVGQYAFRRWGWVGSTLYVSTMLTESQSPFSALYKSDHGGPFVQVDQQGTLAGEQLGMVYLIAGSGTTVYVETGTVQMGPEGLPAPPTIYRSTDSGASWAKTSFTGGNGAIYAVASSEDGRQVVGMDARDSRQLELSSDGRTWRKLPAIPASFPYFGNVWVAGDGSVAAMSNMAGRVDHPDNSVVLARAGATSWGQVASVPDDGTLIGMSAGAGGHPVALWASYTSNAHAGNNWLLLSHLIAG